MDMSKERSTARSQSNDERSAKPRAAARSRNIRATVRKRATSGIDTRQRILNVATEEFSAKGYDGARVDDIMRMAKVSKNLIYHYF
jgi:TetR/AcrR family transcriptional regulator